MSHPERVVCFSSDEELVRWSAADDVVMGGVSSSRLVATAEGTALFSGEVSLSNGGGFASVRSSAAARDLVGAQALILRARGDGKRYQLRLRTSATYAGISYLGRFQTEPGTWREFTLARREFVPTWRGRRVSNAPALDLSCVQSFGFLIADGQEGPFALEVAWIAGAPARA